MTLSYECRKCKGEGVDSNGYTCQRCDGTGYDPEQPDEPGRALTVSKGTEVALTRHGRTESQPAKNRLLYPMAFSCFFT